MNRKIVDVSLRVLVSSALVLGSVPTAALAEGVDEVKAVEKITALEEPADAEKAEAAEEGEEHETPEQDGELQTLEASEATDEAEETAEAGVDEKADESEDAKATEEVSTVEEVYAYAAASSDSNYIVKWTKCGTCVWSIDSAGNLVVKPADGKTTGELSEIPWQDYAKEVTSVRFEGVVKAPSNISYMFGYMEKLERADLSGLDTSKVTNMYSMFEQCHSLTDLDVSGLDTSHVTNMNGMFMACESLASLDLSSFDTSSVTDMAVMFDFCSSLASLDLSGFDTSHVTTMEGMFGHCSSLMQVKLGSRFSFCGANGKRMTALPEGSWRSSADGKSYTANEIPNNVAASYRMTISITEASVKVAGQTYSGKALEPAVTVKLGDKTLVKGTDYDVKYSNNVNVGTATVTVTGKGAYTGTKTSSFTIVAADASKATVKVAAQTHTGKALTPEPTVSLGGKTLKKGTDYDVSYSNNTNVGTATATVKFKGNYSGTAKGTFKIEVRTASISYQAHVQNIGWQKTVADGAVAGTSGKSLRVEALRVSVDGAGTEGSVQIRAHVQNIGWQDWSSEGGTTGQSKRVEAMQLRLTGDLAERYDIYYRVHAQNFGWMGWAKNGASAGTEGMSLRLEAIQVKLVPKGGAAPGSTANAFRKAPATVQYQAHVQNIGWQAAVTDGAVAGTSGKSLRVEALKVSLKNADYAGGVQIRAHVQDIGWQGWSTTGGTSGQSKRVEAMQIRLTGEMANHYDVYYRVHAQNIGWMGWAKNGEQAGTAGYSYRLEAVQVKLVPKGSAAPGSTANRFQSR